MIGDNKREICYILYLRVLLKAEVQAALSFCTLSMSNRDAIQSLGKAFSPEVFMY